jgi:hypothetical protein
MQETFNATAATVGRMLPDSLRQHGVLVGGVVAGLVLVGLATYAFGTVKSTTPPATLLSASECAAQPISIVLGQNAEMTMTVSPRTRCQIPTGFATASFEEFSIVDPPRHGRVMQQDGGVVYQSSGNFRGQDSFALAMRGKMVDAYDGTVDGTSVVRTYVTVK